MNIKNIYTNLQNYKRFFTFGCSFTSHIWPTWADVLASEMPNVKFYNFGLAGSGNPMICSRIVEANKRFKFNNDDLVIVMFSTFYREDRYANESWIPRGNVYNGSIFDDKFLRTYADPTGYLIRDFSLIEYTLNYFKNVSCTSICLLSANYKEDLDMATNVFEPKPGHSIKVNQVCELYHELLADFPKTLKEVVCGDDGRWLTGHSYKWNDEIHDDPHPNTKMYLDYLNYLKFSMTSRSYDYVQESMDKLKQCNDRNHFSKFFPDVDKNVNVSRNDLF